jgi:uncharacterized protein
MDMLTQRQGHLLVRLARQRIEERLGIKSAAPIAAEDLQDPALQEHRGVFVTLHKKNKELRGCIGSLAAVEAIVDGIGSHALNAAFDDHRFAPVSAAELAHLHIEVSVLTEPETAGGRKRRRTAPAVATGQRRGHSPGAPGSERHLFAPGLAAASFARAVSRASLPQGRLAEQAWRTDSLRFFVYQVQSFAEPR